MDGSDYLRRLRQLLDEETTGTWLDTRTSYDNLYEGSKEFNDRTRTLTDFQKIQTVAEQENYVLKSNFSRLFMMNNNRYFIRYSNGSSDSPLYYKDYQDIAFSNYSRTYDINQSTMTRATTTFKDIGQDFSDWETAAPGTAIYKIIVTHTSGDIEWAYIGDASTGTNTDDTITVYSNIGLTSTGWTGTSGTPLLYEIKKVSTSTMPGSFSIRDKRKLYSQITGTATSDGAASGGECTLTDTSGLFLTTDYTNKGDVIYNTGDGSSGVVLSITTTTALKSALFGGTNNDWTSTDPYVIQPQGRLELIIDPPPKTAGHIITLEYIARPDPVYSDYGSYKFRDQNMEAIIKYAAWLYKYRDSEPNFGDAFFQWWDRVVRREAANINPHLNQRKWKVNFKARR
ncbi:MAG: hypothetical protein ABIF11_05480 [Nitrospirota bacterium]|uniref:Uncharacterized protein n=1 Tax=viral metagenome TaxID=1070528 RepID=A0A6M3L668_9ZZZZ